MKEYVLGVKDDHKGNIEYILVSSSLQNNGVYGFYSLDKAIAAVERGEDDWVVIGEDKLESKVVVRTRNGKKYLTTLPDSTDTNNLLEVHSLYTYL